MKEHILRAYKEEDGSIIYRLQDKNDERYADMSLENLHIDQYGDRIAGNFGIVAGTGMLGFGIRAIALDRQAHTEQQETQPAQEYTPPYPYMMLTCGGLGGIVLGMYFKKLAKEKLATYNTRLSRMPAHAQERIKNIVSGAYK